MPFSNEVDVMSNFKHQIIQDRRRVRKSERASNNVMGIIYPLILIGLTKDWSAKNGVGGIALLAHLGSDSPEYYHALTHFLSQNNSEVATD